MRRWLSGIRRYWKFLILTVLMCLFWSYTHKKKMHPLEKSSAHSVVGSFLQPTSSKTNEMKTILMWNRPEDWGLNFNLCEYKNCILTDDKRNISKSDAVVFHTGDKRLKNIPKRAPGQVYVSMSLEPPERMTGNLTDKKWFNVFNWTWSYRRDADLFEPYGEYIPRNEEDGFSKLNFSKLFRSKSKFGAIFVSHCNTESKREKYAEILQRYVSVDVYGKCGPHECGRGNHGKCLQLLKQYYKFYLSFENSLCLDYITEKALQNLDQLVIAITRGCPNMDMFLPPNSYIETSKFSTVHELAEYLRYLASNETEYEKYFQWRKHYKLRIDHTTGLCDLCRKLHNVDRYRGLYRDIYSWITQTGEKPICNTHPNDIR